MAKQSELENKLDEILKDQKDFPKYKRNVRGKIPGSSRMEIDFWFGPKYKVGIEVQGGIWMSRSGHKGAGQVRDYKKCNLAQIGGIILLQFSSDMIRDSDNCISTIKDALKRAGWKSV